MHKLPARAYPVLQNVLTQMQNRSVLFSMAMGYTIAHHTPLPQGKINNPEEFFSGCESETRYSFVGVLSDSIPVDYDAIRKYAQEFWMVKYYQVNGRATPPLTHTNMAYNLTYLSVCLSPESLEILEKGGHKFADYVQLGDNIYDSIVEQNNKNKSVVELVAA